MFFAVRVQRGGPWDWSRDLRQQDGFDEHARFTITAIEPWTILLDGRR